MSLSCNRCALSGVCLPSGLDEADFQKVEEKIQTGVRVKKGRQLYSDGQDFTGLYAVKSGSFKSIVSTSDGEEQIVSFHTPGELMGFDGFGADHSVTALALEASMACKITTENLEYLTTHISGIAGHVNSMVANDINAHNSVQLLIAQKSVEDRVLCFLKNMADRFEKRGFSGTRFTLSMSRGDIANFLGMAPETVSRLFARLSDDDVVHFDQRDVHVINPKELQRRSCGHSLR